MSWPPAIVIRSLAGEPEVIHDLDALPASGVDMVRAGIAFDGDGVDRSGRSDAVTTATGEKPGARETMVEFVGKMRENGASAEWAESHARTAARSWDRGVETGRIQRPTNRR